ncbi:discoidin domain-containing protein [Rubritalea marina]|uniref:discoidin domain-containing protein n=1 Tax=Rubritalea marina TaxID=361055 RepID=UPI0003757320|nr:discoidin domain-containing protein [Rubritalea marina]
MEWGTTIKARGKRWSTAAIIGLASSFGSITAAAETPAPAPAAEPAATSATIEAKHYRDIFSRRLGLFIHWNEKMTDYEGKRSPNKAAYYAAIDIEKIADDIAALGFDYVILTNYHGMAIMHPSEVLNKWGLGHMAAPRDVIGEMIDALDKRGIDMVMFTHPLLPSLFTPEAKKILGIEVINENTNYSKWNDFTNELFAEFAERYGSRIIGLGFDSTLGTMSKTSVNESPGILDLPRLRETITSRAPNLGLYGLLNPTELTEFKVKEVWRAHWHEPWKKLPENDYNVENWPSYREMTAVVQGLHWAPISGHDRGIARLTGEQMFRYSVFLAGTTVEGGGACWAASPYADGRWEKGVREAFQVWADLVKPVRESLSNVYCSSSYPVQSLLRLKSLPNGIVATRSTDDRKEYIHVLNPPAGKTLTLPAPADGKQFLNAKLLVGGAPVTLAQSPESLSLTLTDNSHWHSHNTVIVLETAPQTLPRKSLTLHCQTLCSSAFSNMKKWASPRAYFNRRFINDGQSQAWDDGQIKGWGNKGWSSQAKIQPEEEWIAIDFETPSTFTEVVLHPRQDAGYGQPTKVIIEVSNDGTSWTEIESRHITLGDTKPQHFKCKPQTSRYVRARTPEYHAYCDKNTGMYLVQWVEMAIY